MIYYGVGMWMFALIVVAIGGAGLGNVVVLLGAIFLALWAIYKLLDERLPREKA